MWRLRRRSGKPILAATSDVMMTPIARKIARSRAGNADPSFMTSGRVNTHASVMAPRTPAKDIAARLLQSGSQREPPRLARVSRTELHTHVNPTRAQPRGIRQTTKAHQQEQ